MFPTWETLAQKLIEESAGAADAPRITAELLKRTSLDSVIQAAQSRLGLDAPAFVVKLSRVLYEPMRAVVPAAEWAIVARALDANGPGELSTADWATFLARMQTAYPAVTADALSAVIVDSLTQTPPTAVLSFNAEPLMLALANARACARGVAQQFIDKQLGMLSARRADRIPYYFCHGLLPVPTLGPRSGRSSTDKLVFTESSYLQLSNTVFSWQSAGFLSTCATTPTVFVGLSFSDSNLRRWLASIQSRRESELAMMGRATVDSTLHYWIRRSTGDDTVDRWIESWVGHLGVRLVWIDTWQDAGPTLRRMLNLP